jgi:cysteinyl-tRNA synthetase
MEVVQKYANGFHEVMHIFNILDPDIEPSATQHIQEQIAMAEKLLERGYAYEVNGSVYFDVEKYDRKYGYGVLSGRVLEELVAGLRDLEGQEEKRNKADFALWKKAGPTHIMRWNSPWGQGFPGWHLECSVMSTKYLGDQFDIHGGGMDLKFPHHECEIAQSVGAAGKPAVKYWLHGNMLTINGQKMSKSLGNWILPGDLFTGNHPLLQQSFSPMTVRFFMLQSHYSSTLDFSNDALRSAAKGYKKLINGLVLAKELRHPGDSQVPRNEQEEKQIAGIIEECYRAMDDDFNTAQAIAHLFNLLKRINTWYTQPEKMQEIGAEVVERLRNTFIQFIEEVLGLREEQPSDARVLLAIILDLYAEAKQARQFDKVDEIRARLKTQGIVLKDMKNKIGWAYEE